MKRLICFFLFSIPVLSCLIFVNYKADPGNLFGTASEKMVELFMDGKSAYVKSGNVEEREVDKKIIEALEESPECIAVGPSLVRWVNSDMVGSEDFYNLGMSSGNGYDVLAIFGQLERNDKMPDKVLFCVDTLFFDKTIMENNKSWLSYEADVQLALDMIGSSTELKASKLEFISTKTKKPRQLISLTYFQSSMQYISENGISSEEKIGEPKSDYKGAYYLKDNARVSAYSQENISKKDVEEAMKKYVSGESNSNLEAAITPNVHLDSEQMDNFKKLVTYLQSNNIEIKFFLHPFPPIVWDYIVESEKFPMVTELDTFIHEYSRENNIPITGSYNPYDIGCKNEDFQDYRHMKAEKLYEYFDFTF